MEQWILETLTEKQWEQMSVLQELFSLLQKELMCKLVGIKAPAEYHVLKEVVFSKLEKDKSQLEAVEW